MLTVLPQNLEKVKLNLTTALLGINSVDDWDSYDKQNNGNVDIFIGRYDYNNKVALDKNLRTIQYHIRYLF